MADNQLCYNGINKLTKIITDNNYQNIFVVTNQSSYSSCGAEAQLNGIFGQCNIQHQRFYNFSPNPKIEDAKKGIAQFKANNFDAIIGIGGGSAMDMAKLINSLATINDDITPYIKGTAKLTHNAAPLIAIPTTSGSGSEATHFAVAYIGKDKYSLAYDFMLPDIAILDAQFTAKLPAHTTAVTGMDALCQAIESYWCVNSNDQSQSYAKTAIGLILANLEDAVNNPTPQAREAMAQAAYHAGQAINITKTTAPHAFSYPITSYYQIPHGHAVALTLGKFFLYNSAVNDNNVNDPRGASHVAQAIAELCDILSVANPITANEKITKLMHNIGLETDFKKLGINDINVILDNVNAQRIGNNPVKVDMAIFAQQLQN